MIYEELERNWQILLSYLGSDCKVRKQCICHLCIFHPGKIQVNLMISLSLAEEQQINKGKNTIETENQ